MMVIVRFKRTIRRSGGSAAVAIPPEILNALKWKVGNIVELYAGDEEVVIRKAVK